MSIWDNVSRAPSALWRRGGLHYARANVKKVVPLSPYVLFSEFEKRKRKKKKTTTTPMHLGNNWVGVIAEDFNLIVLKIQSVISKRASTAIIIV